MREKRNVSSKMLAIMLAATTAVGTVAPAVTAYADTYSYTAPTTAMALNAADVNGDGNTDNIITATAHRAASPLVDMLGANITSGNGIINGSAPTSLATAQAAPALGIWGSSLNDQPDPYYWNYFYNFYAAAQTPALEAATFALLNNGTATSPAVADATTTYGGVSVSLSTRPQIVLGTAASNGSSATDTTGYNSQLDTIHSLTSDSDYYHDGDAAYSPELVPYQLTKITDMITTVKAFATAMDNVTAKTGSVGRYGDPDVIAGNYEKYIYGISAYIRSEIAAGNVEKKTVAIVSARNSDDTYTLVGNTSELSPNTTGRMAEDTALITDNLANEIGTTTATYAQLKQADAIVAIGNSTIATKDQILTDLNSVGDTSYSGMVITTAPSTLYGITVNSVENAMGLGYIDSYLYSDVLPINPVDVSAYFYEKFYHVTNMTSLQTVVQTNFANTILPDGITTSNFINDYSSKDVEKLLIQGMNYYDSYKKTFSNTYIGSKGQNWVIDWSEGIGSGQDQTISGVSNTYSKVYKKGATFTLSATATAGAVTYASSKESVAAVDATSGKVTLKGAGTATITVTAAGTGKYAAATKTVTVTVAKAAQTITAAKSSVSYKASALSKKAATFSIGAKTSGDGKLTYKVSTGTKYISVTSAGKVTVKKASKKGTYKVTVTAAATTDYTKATKTVTITVK